MKLLPGADIWRLLAPGPHDEKQRGRLHQDRQAEERPVPGAAVLAEEQRAPERHDDAGHAHYDGEADDVGERAVGLEPGDLCHAPHHASRQARPCHLPAGGEEVARRRRAREAAGREGGLHICVYIYIYIYIHMYIYIYIYREREIDRYR